VNAAPDKTAVEDALDALYDHRITHDAKSLTLAIAILQRTLSPERRRAS